MIVYVETNFVLELAFLQEESEVCSAIVELSETAQIDLIIPAYSLVEPYEALVRRSRRRRELSTRISEETRELSRSKPYNEITERARDITSVFINSGEEEKRRFEITLARILNCAEVVPLDSTIITDSISAQASFSLSPQDAIVYISVLNHLDQSPSGLKCFLNKNTKDFLNPDVLSRLESHECRLIPRFAQGLEYIRTDIG